MVSRAEYEFLCGELVQTKEQLKKTRATLKEVRVDLRYSEKWQAQYKKDANQSAEEHTRWYKDRITQLEKQLKDVDPTIRELKAQVNILSNVIQGKLCGWNSNKDDKEDDTELWLI